MYKYKVSETHLINSHKTCTLTVHIKDRRKTLQQYRPTYTFYQSTDRKYRLLPYRYKSAENKKKNRWVIDIVKAASKH